MKNMVDYMKRSLEERRAHLDLTEECVERGGNSTQHRGILVEFLGTEFPTGRIHLCHACNNGGCSNPKHLYWGTPKENCADGDRHNNTWRSPFDRKVEKYGYDEACRMNARGDKSKGGKANKGKSKSEEHVLKIKESKRHNSQ